MINNESLSPDTLDYTMSFICPSLGKFELLQQQFRKSKSVFLKTKEIITTKEKINKIFGRIFTSAAAESLAILLLLSLPAPPPGGGDGAAPPPPHQLIPPGGVELRRGFQGG